MGKIARYGTYTLCIRSSDNNNNDKTTYVTSSDWYLIKWHKKHKQTLKRTHRHSQSQFHFPTSPTPVRPSSPFRFWWCKEQERMPLDIVQFHLLRKKNPERHAVLTGLHAKDHHLYSPLCVVVVLSDQEWSGGFV